MIDFHKNFFFFFFKTNQNQNHINNSFFFFKKISLIRSENTTHVTFTGHGTVFYEDSLGELDGIALGARQVSSVVRFELSQVIFILQLF